MLYKKIMFVSQIKRDIALHIEVWTVMGVHGFTQIVIIILKYNLGGYVGF